MSVRFYKNARRHVTNGSEIRNFRENFIVFTGVERGLNAIEKKFLGLQQRKIQK